VRVRASGSVISAHSSTARSLQQQLAAVAVPRPSRVVIIIGKTK